MLFTLSQLNQWLGAGEDSSVVRSCYNVEFPDGGQPWVATVVSGKGKNGGKPTSIYTVVDFKSGKKVWGQEYPGGCHGIGPLPSSNSLAFVRQHNLYVTTKEGQTMAVSSDGATTWCMEKPYIVTSSALPKEHSGVRTGNNSLSIGWTKIWCPTIRKWISRHA